MASRKISEFFNKQNTQSSSPTEPKQCPISGPSKTVESDPGPPYIDMAIGEEKVRQLEQETKLKLLQTRWENSHMFSFPSRKIYGRERKFNNSWLNDHVWMRYSVSEDSVYCVWCVLFGATREKTRLFVKPGVYDWVNFSNLVKRHENSENHKSSKTLADNFIDVSTGKEDSILSKISATHKIDVANTRHIVSRIIEVLLLCGRQNIAIRGHTEQTSNFTAILTMLSKEDIILNDHLENPNVQFKYTSPDIQNELLNICAEQIVTKISERIQQSRYFAVLADECTDSSTNEQLSICIRYLVHEGPEVSVKEDFLCFVNVDDTKGETIARHILEVLEQNGLDVNKLRAQGYDGAANMSGKFRGVQAIIRETAPYASYVHCKSHQLNLALVHSSSLPCVRTVMATVQDIAFSFDYSAKRLAKFKSDLSTNENAQQEMEKRTKLRTLCETRWSSRADALKTFKASFAVVVSSLDFLKDDGDDKAGVRLSSILRFDFIIGLVVSQHILSSTVALSDFLQRPRCNLLEAVREGKVIIRMLQNERADDSVWDALYDEAVNLAAEYEITPSAPRRAGRQRHRANPDVNDPKQYWKITLYLAFLDHLISELETRLIESEGRFKAEALLPTNITREVTDEVIQNIYDAYTYDADLTEPDVYRQEVQRWRVRWSLLPAEQKPNDDVATCLNQIDPQMYPNIHSIFLLLLTMPVSTATAERSFSSMKRVKTYLRSTMTTERLSSLATLHIHRDEDVNIEKVVNTFAHAKSFKRLNRFT